MSRESVFENIGNGFSNLEILQEPIAKSKDKLKLGDLKYLETL